MLKQSVMSASNITFEELFQSDQLLQVYESKFASSTTKGVDRLNGTQFRARAREVLSIVSEKCLAGAFRFSPYLETLRSKGRGKLPRVISIPTLRDRVVLNQLNRILASIFPESVPRNIAATYIRDLARELAKL